MRWEIDMDNESPREQDWIIMNEKHSSHTWNSDIEVRVCNTYICL